MEAATETFRRHGAPLVAPAKTELLRPWLLAPHATGPPRVVRVLIARCSLPQARKYLSSAAARGLPTDPRSSVPSASSATRARSSLRRSSQRRGAGGASPRVRSPRAPPRCRSHRHPAPPHPCQPRASPPSGSLKRAPHTIPSATPTSASWSTPSRSAGAARSSSRPGST